MPFIECLVPPIHARLASTGRSVRVLASRCGGNSQEVTVISGEQLYDTIGTTYTVTRRTDPRIAAQVWAALGDAQTVLNVGAGTGSYEPSDRDVTAVEPSAVIALNVRRAQRLACLLSPRAFRWD